MDRSTEEKFWNVPNLITLTRIALVPVLALMLFQKRAFGALIIVFLAGRSLGFPYVIPLWRMAVVIARDFIILAGGVVIFLIRGRREFPPTIFGKVSNVFQVATLFWVILSNYVRASA